MKTKTWIVLFAFVLLACGGLSAWLLLPSDGEGAALAEVTSQGEIVATVELAVDREFTVENGDAYNIITVRDGKIAVTEASCPDHYCMKRGYCNSGTEIVCLPNRLVIKFLGDQAVDALVG